MKDETYNGWTNYETWLTYLHYGDWFYDTVHEYEAEERADIGALTEMLEDYCHDIVSEGYNADGASLVADIVGSFMRSVNWYEIAKHANED